MKKYIVTVTAYESPEFSFRKEFETRIEVDDFLAKFDPFNGMTFRQSNAQGLATETSLVEANGFHLTIQVIDRGTF